MYFHQCKGAHVEVSEAWVGLVTRSIILEACLSLRECHRTGETDCQICAEGVRSNSWLVGARDREWCKIS